jgi:Na+/melibiose symporter-like transporter
LPTPIALKPATTGSACSSVFALSDKAGLALAVGIALPLVALLGFNPGHANSADALFHLKAVFALGPALAHLLSAAIIRGPAR